MNIGNYIVAILLFAAAMYCTKFVYNDEIILFYNKPVITGIPKIL